MIHFTLSAPSKLSLFGELAVKYGKNGLTGSIDLRTTLTFTELPFDNFIQIEFSQINLLIKIPLGQFLRFYDTCSFDESANRLHEQVLKFVTSNYSSFLTNHQKIIAQAFFYLLVYIAHEKQIDITRSFNVHLSTQLIIDEDSVCLPSITVCLAACFLQWSHLQKGDPNKLNVDDFKEVISYARRCKEISVESDSIGVTVCTYGSVIRHQSEENAEGIVITDISPICKMPSVTILLVDSKQTQNLETQMQKVTELVNDQPVVARFIFDNINVVTNNASVALKRLCDIHNNIELDIVTKYIMSLLEHFTLTTFIDTNQRLLDMSKVSPSVLNTIWSKARKHGLNGTYTDICERRYAYIWCLPNVSSIAKLSEELKIEGFNVVETNLFCDGVRLE